MSITPSSPIISQASTPGEDSEHPVYISSCFPNTLRDALIDIAKPLGLPLSELDNASIILFPPPQAVYIDRQAHSFHDELARVVASGKTVVSHHWLVDCGVDFVILPIAKYQFSPQDYLPAQNISESSKSGDAPLGHNEPPDDPHAIHTESRASSPLTAAPSPGPSIANDETSRASSSGTSDTVPLEEVDLGGGDDEGGGIENEIGDAEYKSPARIDHEQQQDSDSSRADTPERRKRSPGEGRNQLAVREYDQKAFESLVTHLNERFSRQPRNLGRIPLFRQLDKNFPHPKGTRWQTMYEKYQDLLLEAIPGLRDYGRDSSSSEED